MSESKGPSMFRVDSHLPRLAFSDFDIWIINALILYLFSRNKICQGKTDQLQILLLIFNGAESFIAGTRFIDYFENRHQSVTGYLEVSLTIYLVFIYINI